MESTNSIPVRSLVGQNEPPVAIGSHTQSSKPIGDNNKMAHGRFAWSRNRLGISLRVRWVGNRGVWESCVCVGCRHVSENE
jgi:hypothetical protein